jgi:hypothetical protein
MAFTPMTEYRLVVGVLGIIFDEDSASEAKRQFDLFVIQSKTARSAEVGASVGAPVSGSRKRRLSQVLLNFLGRVGPQFETHGSDSTDA